MKTVVRFACAALLAVVATAVQAADDQSIGKAHAVKSGANAGIADAKRLIAAGGDIFFGETITTDLSGGLRIVFDDRSKLELGPGSTLVINEFVYRGKASAQKMALSLVKGVFRFTTGKMKKKAYQLGVGDVQFGVRGTKFAVLADGKGGALVKVQRGQVEMKAGGRTLRLKRGRGGGFDAASGKLAVRKLVELEDLDDGVESMDASLGEADVSDSVDAGDADAGDAGNDGDAGGNDGGSDDGGGSADGSDDGGGTDGGSDGGDDGGGTDGGGGDGGGD